VDAENQSEKDGAKIYFKSGCLKVGYLESKNLSTKAFLNLAKPTYSIIKRRSKEFLQAPYH
jgi:competence protein ComEC